MFCEINNTKINATVDYSVVVILSVFFLQNILEDVLPNLSSSKFCNCFAIQIVGISRFWSLSMEKLSPNEFKKF